jgi:hypothetical protein
MLDLTHVHHGTLQACCGQTVDIEVDAVSVL